MNLHTGIKRPCHMLLVLLLTAVLLVAASGGAEALYILTGTDASAVVMDGSSLPALDQKLIDLGSGQRGHDTVVNAGTTVYVEHDDSVTLLQSTGETISSLLTRANAAPGPLEMVGVNVSDDSVTLTVADHLICYERVTESAAYSVTYTTSPELPQGTERVVRPGADGVHTCVYEQVWSGGVLASRQMVEELSTTVVNELREQGTDVDYVAKNDTLVSVNTGSNGSGYLVFASGATMKFSQAKDMTATAYTAGHGGADYTTATGEFVKLGVVAVDKRVIPLGTRMYIVTDDGIVYGVSTAADTGVRGNIVDLYMETYRDCINFGRRGCTVYILE